MNKKKGIERSTLTFKAISNIFMQHLARKARFSSHADLNKIKEAFKKVSEEFLS